MKRRPGTTVKTNEDAGFIFDNAWNKPIVLDSAPTAISDMTEGVPGINGSKFYFKFNGQILSLPVTVEVSS